MVLYFSGFYDNCLNENYIDWYYLNGTFHAEPNTFTRVSLTGIGVILKFVEFYYINI